jgi:branched-chain amino acid transport system permease protein
VLTYIVIGIIQGAVLGLLALGIVLVYKGSRVFNFAQAEFGTVGAFILLWLVDGMLGLPMLVALPIALVLIGAVGFSFERLVVRPLFNAPRVTLLVATAGAALLAIALELQLGGVAIKQIDPIKAGTAFTLFGAPVTYQQLILLSVLGGLAAGLAYFFNRTDLGLAVLATSQEPVATELVGIGTKRMSSFIWTFAAILGGIAGILQAPDTTFTAGFMTVNFLLFGFTAAVIGGITSLSGAFVGGQLIGITTALSQYFDVTYLKRWGADIPAFHELVLFILLLVVLYVRPQGLLGKEA